MPPSPDLQSVRWKLELLGDDEELRALAKMFDPRRRRRVCESGLRRALTVCTPPSSKGWTMPGAS
jgi:hypothetical protein